MEKALKTLIAATAALALCGGAYAQNNTLATPSVKSPVAAAAATTANSGYGTPGATGSDSGMAAGSLDKTADKSMNVSPAPGAGSYGSHNTLATPSVASPATQ
ncbi:hypothetical protein [Paraburkholderia sp. J12]|uniref:hypothetical protein n=1 Tax=Paraburkholderia sp. J12 TaxID=2805432 RepID=UPI002ABD3A9C|nr:hypothetical protein [Paraburkholderia sp. J12]